MQWTVIQPLTRVSVNSVSPWYDLRAWLGVKCKGTTYLLLIKTALVYATASFFPLFCTLFYCEGTVRSLRLLVYLSLVGSAAHCGRECLVPTDSWAKCGRKERAFSLLFDVFLFFIQMDLFRLWMGKLWRRKEQKETKTANTPTHTDTHPPTHARTHTHIDKWQTVTEIWKLMHFLSASMLLAE